MEERESYKENKENYLYIYKENKALCQVSRNFRMRFLRFLWHESTAYRENKWFINPRLAPNTKKR